MEFEDFVCRRCGSEELVVETDKEGQPILICTKCRTLRKKIRTHVELLECLDYMQEKGADGIAYLDYRYDEMYGMYGRCSRCHQILFYTEDSPDRKRKRFDLRQSNYCPFCGSRFIKF